MNYVHAIQQETPFRVRIVRGDRKGLEGKVVSVIRNHAVSQSVYKIQLPENYDGYVANIFEQKENCEVIS